MRNATDVHVDSQHCVVIHLRRCSWSRAHISTMIADLIIRILDLSDPDEEMIPE